jgi:uncharacterized protein
MATAFLLSLFTCLLVLRVVGQIVVVLRAPSWLPPMEQWQSGLLPYPMLLAAQIVVLTIMVEISVNVIQGRGIFIDPRRPEMGRAIVWFSYVYFAGMVARYIIRMTRRPDQRWFGGTIPIIFHSFVAAFLFTYGQYHLVPPR